MKTLKYLITGIAFGIIMFKSEAASWFRIFKCSNLIRSICTELSVRLLPPELLGFN